MKKTYKVHCLDNGLVYEYMAKCDLEALEYHLYYLSLSSGLDINKSVTKTDNGIHLMVNNLT